MANKVPIRDASYHESAIVYNDALAEFAKELSSRIEHPEVARWPLAISKQHEFHAERHRNSLAKLKQREENPAIEVVTVPEPTAGIEVTTVPEPEEQPEVVREDVPKATGNALSPFELAKARRAEQEEGQNA